MCVRAASAPDHRAAAPAARQCGRSTSHQVMKTSAACRSRTAVRVKEHKGEQPWQRASGRSSRITVVVHACTASVPVCAPVPVAPSSRRVAVRAAPSSPLKRRAPEVLPKQHKFTSPTDFSRTIKRGRRAGSRTVVVHLNEPDAGATPAHQGGPRVGLIVSKAVGNAVLRHRTSRRLRHVLASLFDALPPTVDIVVRALPASGGASSADLERDLRKALRRLGALHE